MTTPDLSPSGAADLSPADAGAEQANVGSPPRAARQRREPYPLGSAAQALSVFALLGASVGLFLGTFTRMGTARFSSFLEHNDAAQDLRWWLFEFLLGGAVLALLPCFAILVWKGRRVLPALLRAAEISWPLCLIGLLRSLFTALPWHDQPLTFLI